MNKLSREPALLVWQDGGLVKDQWVLDQTSMTVGRAPDCEVRIDSRWISRAHARIQIEEDYYVLEDLGSRNGVFVNGQRVTDPQPLEAGDRIQIAPDLELIFVDSETTMPFLGPPGPGLGLDQAERREAPSLHKIDWRTITRRIKAGKCTPIISYRVSSHHFSDNEDVIRAWADEIGYPMADRHDPVRVAQYASITSRDALLAKEEYLDFVKQRLFDKARDEQTPAQSTFLDTLEDELFDLSFSEVAARLGYPGHEDEMDNPLRILAELPLPIYLTSNFATFMEGALTAAGKEPRTEICYWHDDLQDDVTSVFEEDPDYEPSVEKPLVCHIHGLDAFPSSLVLAEDDYLDFLVKVSQDTEAIPMCVSQALVDSSLLLLGYQLQDWDFKVIFRGMIATKRSSRRLLSLSIQLVPDSEGLEDLQAVQEYMQRYFDSANFEIYWGDTQSFTQELWEQWED